MRSIRLFTLLLGLLWLCSGTSAFAADKASMALATKPAAANYVLYNVQGKIVLQGKTPYIGMVAAGRYRLIIQKPGFFPEQRSIQVQGGQQKILQITLFPKPAGSKPAAPAIRPVAPVQPQAGKPRPRLVPKTNPGTPRVAPRKVPDLRPVVRGVPKLPNVPVARVKPKARPNQAQGKAQQPKGVEGPPPPPAANEIPPKPRQGGSETPAKTAAKKVVAKKKKPKKAKRSIPWIPLAAAGGLAIAGGIFWGLSSGALDASKDLNRTQIDAFNEYKQARSHRNTAVFLFAGGGVALGLAALFYFWPPSSDKKGKKRNVPGNDVPIIGFTFESY